MAALMTSRLFHVGDGEEEVDILYNIYIIYIFLMNTKCLRYLPAFLSYKLRGSQYYSIHNEVNLLN